MNIAITEKGQRIKAFPNGRAFCPNCKSVVKAKCGELNVWHWAHDKNCDDWIYEPKTEWHLEWQNYFKEEQTEVYLEQNGQYHRADIYTEKKLVIEIQNSPISTNEVSERENFYGDMIWVVNSKDFKHNINLKQFQSDLSKEIWFQWVNQFEPEDEKAFAIIIPKDDFGEQIINSVKLCNYKKAIDIEKGVEFWYNRKKQFNQKLDKEILDAFSSYYLDKKIQKKVEINGKYDTKFKWSHIRKTWTTATKPIFIDLNNGYLMWIMNLYENGNGFGRVISKQKFLLKYRPA